MFCYKKQFSLWVDSCKTTIFTLAQLQCDRCLLVSAFCSCVDCIVNYCASCYTVVHKGPTLSQHRLVVPPREKPPKPRPCDLHPDERIKYLCSCGALICRDSEKSIRHNGHTSKLIDEVAPSIIEKVSIQECFH